MTYEQTWDAVMEALQSRAEKIGIPLEQISAGRYREQPGTPPFVWVYLEPGPVLTAPAPGSGDGQATVLIFIGSPPAVDSRTANIEGHRTATEVVRALVDRGLRIAWPQAPISLDEISPLYTAHRVECAIAYELE